MNKNDAQELWDCIHNYAVSCWELGGEGNSGEFYDRREEARLDRCLKENRKELCDKFYELTGWKPVITNDPDDIYLEWELTQ